MSPKVRMMSGSICCSWTHLLESLCPPRKAPPWDPHWAAPAKDQGNMTMRLSRLEEDNRYELLRLRPEETPTSDLERPLNL